jgi:putative endonuclease
MSYYVYIIASRKDGAIYIGVTNDIVRRIYEHRTKAVPGFTSRYNITRLVWFEIYDDPIFAISREKELKKWAELEGPVDREGQSGVDRFVRVDLHLKRDGIRFDSLNF